MAFTSSLTFWVPICAANAAPVRPGEYDRRHQCAELAQHRNPHAVDDEDHRAELLGHEPDFKSDDHAHQKPDQHDDRNSIGAGLGGDAEYVAPVDCALPGDDLPKRDPTCTKKPGELPDVGDLLRSRPAYFLEHIHCHPTAGRRGELLGVVAANQSREVRSKLLNLDFRVGGAIAAHQIEEERYADVIGIFESRRIDDDWTFGVARQRVDRRPPDGCRRVGGDPAIEHHSGAVAVARRAR